MTQRMLLLGVHSQKLPLVGSLAIFKGKAIFSSHERRSKWLLMSEKEQWHQRDYMGEDEMMAIPLLDHKDYDAPSVFTAESLLREARRQKGLAQRQVPRICVLDPDGDLVDHLHRTARAQRDPTWACYHTVLDTFVHEGVEYGII